MRYLKRLRIVGLAVLVTAAMAAIPTGPAGAKLVCPPGTHNRIYCVRLASIHITINIKKTVINVTVIFKDPHVKVQLIQKAHVLKTEFNGKTSNTFRLTFKKPTKPGTYEVTVIARARNGTKVKTKAFNVP